MERTELPAGWRWTTLGSVTNTTRNRVNPQDFPDMPFVGMEHVEAHTRRVLQTVPAGTMRSGAETFQPGDVLYGRMRPYLNKVFLADFHGLCSGEFIPFRETPEINSRYLLYFLNSWDFVSFASHLTEGDRPRVDFSQLTNYPFPLPPLPEQQHIVDYIETQFSRLDAAVAALKRVQANLRRYRAAVLKAACAGRLVPTEAALAQAEGRSYEPAAALLQRVLAERRSRWQADHPGKKYKEPAEPDTSALPELSEGWCWATVEQVAEHVTSGSRGWAEHYSDSGALFIRAQDINTDTLKLANVAHVNLPRKITAEAIRTRVRRLDLLITITGANVTKTALVQEELEEAYISQHVALVRLVVSNLSEYLYCWIVSPSHGRAMLERDAYGAGKAGLNLTNINELVLALPPLAEQNRITEEIQRLSSMLNATAGAVKDDLNRAERLRQAVLQQAFSGQLLSQPSSGHHATQHLSLDLP